MTNARADDPQQPFQLMVDDSYLIAKCRAHVKSMPAGHDRELFAQLTELAARMHEALRYEDGLDARFELLETNERKRHQDLREMLLVLIERVQGSNP